MLRRTALLAAAALALASAAMAEPKPGIAMLGDPALPADFKSLPYANPDAPQGGELRQAITGSFDSVNPFIVKGQPVTGTRTYVFESHDLRSALDQIRPNNAQGEYYLTDCPSVLLAASRPVDALPVLKPIESLSINTPEELAVVEQAMQKLKAES